MDNIDINTIGILDPHGKNKNPLTNKEYSDNYKELAKIWSKFPAYQKVYDIIENIKNNQVILITSGTGSGKTVLIPKFTLHVYNYNGNIAITLPKQIIAKSAAAFSANTLDVTLGEEVGYQYKGSPKNSKSNKTKLLYATDGTIVARLLNDPLLTDFDAVIIDEAHERKIQIDFLLYLLRETIKKRPSFKLIIMSATINVDIFKNYFLEYKFKHIDIGGKTNYPIKSIFLEKSIEYKQAFNKGFNILIDILSNNYDKDILFFITSTNEAFDICAKLHKYIKETDKDTCKITSDGNVFCIEVYAGMDTNKQTLAQDKDLYKKNNFNRKVVIATNVAESSLTIDGIKYVIDLGYELNSSYDPNIRAHKLDRKIITQAQAKQRMGRSGRTEPGICYHLYTKNEFENIMEKYPSPDIRVSDISDSALKLLNLDNIKTTKKLLELLTKFIEPPKEIYIRDALNILTQLGLIKNNEITKLGEKVVDISNDPRIGLAIIFSKLYNCSIEIIKIIAMLEASKSNFGNIFIFPNTILKQKTDEDNITYKKRLEYLNKKFDKVYKKFKHKYGDHISLLKLYDIFYKFYKKNKNNYKKLEDWGYKNFIKIDTLIKAYKNNFIKQNNIKKIDLNFNNLNIEKNNNILHANIDDRIIYCLFNSNRINIAVKSHTNNYRTQYAKTIKINIDPKSFLSTNKILPKSVFYDKLFVIMNNANLNMVSKIPKKIDKLFN